MALIDFDPGPVAEPFASLVRDYPGEDVYSPLSFRTEWGPIFHRGRLDGSASLLVIGQDPAQHENACRRILAGLAGQRVQRFMDRLGVTHSYVLFNTFLYSLAPGSPPASKLAKDPKIAAYRNRWFDALVGSGVEGVMCFGTLAHDAFAAWRKTPAGKASDVVVARGTHPTAAWHKPEGPARAQAELDLVKGWNTALTTLSAAVTRDTPGTVDLYDPTVPADLAPIPARDFPAGTPAWMRSVEEWATRDGRETIQITVPESARSWQP